MKILMYILAVILIIAIIVMIILNTKPFGKLPSGERLERIKLSENYKDGKFQNQVETNMMTTDDGFIKSAVKGIYEMLVPKDEENTIPNFELPTQKTDLKNLLEEENIIVWFGHSSIFIQLDGKKILVDPVFGSYGTPFPLNNAFKVTKIYIPDDMPEIDVLIITHDHWDHLDYASVRAIKDKVKKVITPLGVASHLEYWGYDKDIIEEKDWYED